MFALIIERERGIVPCACLIVKMSRSLAMIVATMTTDAMGVIVIFNYFLSSPASPELALFADYVLKA